MVFLNDMSPSCCVFVLLILHKKCSFDDMGNDIWALSQRFIRQISDNSGFFYGIGARENTAACADEGVCWGG